MVCRTEIVNSVLYNYCPDVLPPVANRMQSLMQGRVIDELTGLGLTREVTVSTDIEHVSTRASFYGVCGLVANPVHLFPGLNTNAVSLNMSVRANGYLPQTFVADLGPFNTAVGSPADYPEFFSPVNLGTISMHRTATNISGRCVKIDGISHEPLDNAVVEVAGVWHQFPAANVDPDDVMEDPNIVSLVHGCYRRRFAGGDRVRQLDLVPLTGEEKVLLLSVAAGATQLRVSNRVNLAAGHLVAVDFQNTDLLEYIQVKAVDGATTAEQPATITLEYPLKKEHREGITVLRVNPPSPPTATENILIRNAIAGDQTVYLDALSDIDNSTVEIFGNGIPEYHRVSLYRVVSNSNGYFHLPSISRVAMMKLCASHDDMSNDIDVDYYSPDYDLFENRIDFVFG